MKKKVETEKPVKEKLPKNRKKKSSRLIKLIENEYKNDGYLVETNKVYSRSLERFNITKQIYLDLLNGASHTDCIEKLTSGALDKTYTKNGAEKVYKDARRMVMLDFEVEKPQLKEQLYSYLRDTYSECRKNGDRYNAILAINSIAKLVGLTDNRQQSIQVNTDGPVTIKFGFENPNEEQPQEITDTNYEILDEDGD